MLLTNNTETLRTILDAVKSLPNWGSGGSSDTPQGNGWYDGVPYDLNLISGVRIINETGNEQAYDSYMATDYLPCEGINDIIVSTSTLTQTWRSTYNAFYDKNKVYICGFAFNNGIDGQGHSIVEYNKQEYDENFKIPSNAAYVRFSHDGDWMSQLTFTPVGAQTITVDDPILLMDVANYYQAPVGRVAAEVNGLSDKWTSFVVIADTHGTNNMNNSQNIIRYLLKNSKADKFFHVGGTVHDVWNKEEFEAWFEPFENCIPQVYIATGNRDLTNVPSDEENVIYDTLLADKNYLNGYPSEHYYSFDDTEKKIRYIVLNVSTSDSITSEQVLWLQSTVQLPGADWTIIAFGHIDIVPNDPISSEWQIPGVERISNVLSSTNGTVAGYFCGHQHHDRISKVNDSFYEVILLNDKFEQNWTYPEITNPTRTAGTVTEHAVSVVSINSSNGEVFVRRIGAGYDMYYNYMGNKSDETTWADEIAYTYEAVTNEYVEYTDGRFVAYTGWSRTPYLYCEGASKLRIEVTYPAVDIVEGDSGLYNAFFDKNKKYVGYFDFSNLDPFTKGAYKDIDIPANVAYFVVSSNGSTMGTSYAESIPFIKFIPIK